MLIAFCQQNEVPTPNFTHPWGSPNEMGQNKAGIFSNRVQPVYCRQAKLITGEPASNVPMSGHRPALYRVLAGGLLLALSCSFLVLPLIPVSSSTSNINVVASDAEQVVGVSAFGSPSLSSQGGQNLIEDSFGKFFAIYVDWQGKLSVAFADSHPSSSGAWASSSKSPGTTAYAYPAGVLVNSTSLRIIAENVTDSDLGFPGKMVDVTVTIQRDRK